jgi:hypothetical protein
MGRDWRRHLQATFMIPRKRKTNLFARYNHHKNPSNILASIHPFVVRATADNDIVSIGH